MKNSIWIPIEFKNHYLDCDVSGLRLNFLDIEINKELRLYCINFCRWLRKKYWFPIRCNINFEFVSYYRDTKKKYNNSSSIFYFAKCDKSGYMISYPSIYIAVSEYEKELKIYEETGTLFHYSYLIIHELTHYFQWYFLGTNKRSKRSLEIEANKWANDLAAHYIKKILGRQFAISEQTRTGVMTEIFKN